MLSMENRHTGNTRGALHLHSGIVLRDTWTGRPEKEPTCVQTQPVLQPVAASPSPLLFFPTGLEKKWSSGTARVTQQREQGEKVREAGSPARVNWTKCVTFLERNADQYGRERTEI